MRIVTTFSLLLANSAIVWSLPTVAETEKAADPALAAYRKTLTEFGVQPTGGGAVEYLRGLHPTPQRKREIDALIAQLADGSFSRREEAMRRLMAMPNLPVAQLAAAAEGDDPEVRWRARDLLQQSAGNSARVLFAASKILAVEPADGAVPALLAALPLCQQSHLEATAIDALRACAKPGDAPALRTALASGAEQQRIAAAAALCAVTAQDDQAALYPLLSDRSHRVALEVARSLADVGERRSLPALVRLLDADDNLVRTEAVVTLRGLTGQFMGYAAYDDADKRYAAIKRWNTWVTAEGASAELKFPVPRHISARGDLGGHTLVATGSKGVVREFDAGGKEVWSYPIGSWSAEKLRNGNVLVGSYNENKVVEIDPATKEVVWEYPGINAMTAKPLANGNVLVSDFSGKRVVEIGRNKEIAWEHATGEECFDSDRLPNGNTMFGCPNFVREVTHEGKLVREWKIDGRLNGFQALPSGNILVANFGRSEVVELTPEGKQIWRFAEPNPCDVFRVPSGNTLISTQQRIFEIGPDDKLVREICAAQYGSARK